MSDVLFMDAAETCEVAASDIARILAARADKLTDTWMRLQHAGAIFLPAAADVDEEFRSNYLLPLAKVLIGGLAGSWKHLAIYMDERLRYLDVVADAGARRTILRKAMNAEFRAIGEMLLDRLDPISVEKALWRFHAPLFVEKPATRRILFIGDCVFVETRAFLAAMAWASDTTLDFRQVFFSTNQQRPGVHSAIAEEIRTFQPDIIGLSLFTFEGVPPYSAAWRQAAAPIAGRKALGSVEGLVDLVRQVLDDIRSVTDSTVVVHVPGGLPLHGMRRKLPILPPHSVAQREFLARMACGLQPLLDATPNVIALAELSPPDGLPIPARAASGPIFRKRDVPKGYLHTTKLGPVLAGQYHAIVRDHLLLGRAKAALVDFDNTLWKGVMGDGPVVQYEDRQKLLLELKAAGVLLVALSKNDPALIRWDEMMLKEKDFACLKINWQSKPDNVSGAIRELDLDPSAFVMIDDNPVERALVTERIAGVAALDATLPSTWISLRRWLQFPSTSRSDEARRRTDMYREAAERRRALDEGETHDFAFMMRSLDLRSCVRAAAASDMPRLLELVQRTNQFNTTTKRRSQAEILAMMRDDRLGLHIATLRDRFGALGVVAAVVFDRCERRFDSVVMSCRAMGFGLEIALLRCVMDVEGPGRFHGTFLPTARNSPASDLFRRAGFKRTEADDWLLLEGDEKPAIPDWLTMTETD